MLNQWARPILRWAGSKRKLLSTLTAAIPPDYDRYIEPFAGSACLFFATHPTKALLGDVNAELIEAYAILKRHPRRLARAVHELPRSKKQYYRLRALDASLMEPFERVTRFVYLNRYCFNGVYRTNRNGAFNVPYGSHQGEAPGEDDFFRCSFALRSAELFAGDFEDCLSTLKRSDFVYLDPPYSSTTRPRYGEYGYDSFQPLELQRLQRVLQLIENAGSRFLLSYSDSPAHRKAFSRWTTRSVEVRRHVAGFNKHRNTVSELLVSNYDIANHAKGIA